MNAPLNSNFSRARISACWTLALLTVLLAGCSCGPGKLEEYTTRLREDFDADEREKAAEKLGTLGDPDAVPALREATRDPDDKVREAAAEALGLLADPAAAADLAALLRDPEKDVRRKAVKALGLLGDAGRVSDLLPLLGDRSSDIRQETAEALGRIGSPLALPFLQRLAAEDSDADVRAAAGFAARRIAPEVQ
jgi:HEAT repeat protein